MSLITRNEQENLDIDWYCSINGHPVHIASMGGVIPEPFSERETLRKIEDSVINLPYIAEVKLNHQVVEQETAEGYNYIIENQLSQYIEETLAYLPSFNYNRYWSLHTRLYVCSFVDKARKGFYSYAKIKEHYVLIAQPTTECNALELPPLYINREGIPGSFIMPY